MDYTPFIQAAAVGFTLYALSIVMSDRAKLRALRHHERARAIGHLNNAYARAEMMVQHPGLTPLQMHQVRGYIDLMEQSHRKLGLGATCRFDRLRQSLIRNNRSVRVVV